MNFTTGGGSFSILIFKGFWCWAVLFGGVKPSDLINECWVDHVLGFNIMFD